MNRTSRQRDTGNPDATWEPVQLGPRRIEMRRGWLELREPWRLTKSGFSLADSVLAGYSRRVRGR